MSFEQNERLASPSSVAPKSSERKDWYMMQEMKGERKMWKGRADVNAYTPLTAAIAAGLRGPKLFVPTFAA